MKIIDGNKVWLAVLKPDSKILSDSNWMRFTRKELVELQAAITDTLIEYELLNLTDQMIEKENEQRLTDQITVKGAKA